MLSLGRAGTAAAMITSKVVGLVRLSCSRAPSAWARERASASPIPWPVACVERRWKISSGSLRRRPSSEIVIDAPPPERGWPRP